MELDRTNYEIWLIDWLDGNLDEKQVAQLEQFLRENPDLKAEFEELNSLTLKPSMQAFTGKRDLKKTPSDLASSQFELLCVAFLENDISGSERSELMEYVKNDPEKKRTFDLIQKTSLTPPVLMYTKKNRLTRWTLTQKIIRLSAIGLSAAAALLLIIMTFITVPQELPERDIITAGESITDSVNTKTPVVPEPVMSSSEQLASNNIQERPEPVALIDIKPHLPEPASNNIVPVTSLSTNPARPVNGLEKIPVNARIDLGAEISVNNLIASNYSETTPPYDDGRSNVSRFLARTFREKILKEETPANIPVKGIEIAEAGVTGLNKLLGWEMALEKTNDENGELKSVYFSSRILKFNAPVRKSEPLP